MRKIDSHLHVWAHDPDRYPYLPGREPTARGDAEFLLSLMDAGGIDKAIIIQPIVHGFDHRYVDEALAKWPDRFAGMCLVNPQDDDPVGMLEGFVESGYRGVRFNPALWPDGERMDGDVGRALFAKAGELGIAVGFLCSPPNFDEIDTLCAAYPSTQVMVDHFGHCKPGETQEFDRLLSLSAHSSVHVKLSEWPRASEESWPYRDLFGWIPRLVDAYGAVRLMWGTDFPFIVEQTGYDRGWSIADEIEPALSEADMRDILGGTAAKLFGI